MDPIDGSEIPFRSSAYNRKSQSELDAERKVELLVDINKSRKKIKKHEEKILHLEEELLLLT